MTRVIHFPRGPRQSTPFDAAPSGAETAAYGIFPPIEPPRCRPAPLVEEWARTLFANGICATSFPFDREDSHTLWWLPKPAQVLMTSSALTNDAVCRAKDLQKWLYANDARCRMLRDAVPLRVLIALSNGRFFGLAPAISPYPDSIGALAAFYRCRCGHAWALFEWDSWACPDCGASDGDEHIVDRVVDVFPTHRRGLDLE